MNPTGARGLAPEEARARLVRFGPNRLFTQAPARFWAIAAEEIREPMILLMLVVGVFYSLWGGLGDAITIYLTPLREALSFAALAPADLIVSATLALLLVAPAELRKAFVR